MTQPLNELTNALLQAASRAGADSADALAIEATSLSVDVRAGALEQAERSEDTNIGLRVFVGQRVAIVSASDTSTRTIEEMATRAVAMAREAPEDPFAGLAAPDQISTNWDVDALELSDPTPEPAPEDLQQDATEAEAAGLAVKGISQVQSSSAGYSAQQIWMSASNGFEGGYRRTNRGLSCVTIAGTGTQMERDYDGDSRTFQADLRSARDIGTTAAKRTLERLDARKPPTGAYPVLFDERISSTLLGHLLAAMNGSAIARGASWLRDNLGDQILPQELSVIEDPHRARVSGSRPFDGEGLATAKRTLVQDGVVQGWTLDLANGRKLDMDSTGNAARGTSSGPSPSNWNVSLTQGSASRDELIREMGTGLLVTSMIGSTINPNTGDYSRGASGLWIENGEITYAVNECTIAGNLREMLGSMIPANDARTHLSRVVPSLLVSGMTLAGA